MLASATRLHLRSIRFLLPFAHHASRSAKQALASPGCLSVLTRKTQGLAFWTLTTWENEKSLASFLMRGPHRAAMPKLAIWCDEAVLTHWEHDPHVAPTWQLAAERLLQSGRLSRLTYPSAAHKNGRIIVT
jgi:hypothetical protein